MIYTGYFARLNFYKSIGLTPISICGMAPKWYEGVEYRKFAPKLATFKLWKSGIITNEDYVIRYKNEVLSSLVVEDVYRFLKSFNQDIILLCYEKSTDFCHRHIVSEWIRNELGLNCEELK